MEVACYNMDLYCSFKNKEHEWNEFPHNFTGKSRLTCVRVAKKRGWKFHSNGDHSCPKCSGIKNKEKKNDDEIYNSGMI
jgi:hypothetical protein